MLEDIFKKGTWENEAKFGDAGGDDVDALTIIENMQFWRQCMLCDGRFRGRRTRKPLAGVAGLETELGGQLSDYFARIRCCFPDGLWNVKCERAWLRIYDCVTDVYRINQHANPHQQQKQEGTPGTDLSALDRKEAANDMAPVEFYSDAWGSWTEPKTFY